ncbi:zinc finger protein-domain-containing protein [Xylariaceae sp. FL1019]|nr:zinc finger protein-domain-containing protein [Xylariaceae sp. FL1019]
MASCRKQDVNESEDSDRPPRCLTFTDNIIQSMQILGLLAPTNSIAPASTPAEIDTTGDQELNRCLSMHSVVSASSSFADRRTAAQSSYTEIFTKIGAGSCGAIFAQECKSHVLKLAKSSDFDLWNDYQKHTLISEKLYKFRASMKIPKCYFYIPKDDAKFFDANPTLCEAARTVCNMPTEILVTQRIIPLPSRTRRLLIDKFCSDRIKAKALEDPANKDCLVRVYLGSMQGKSGGMFFSLRNFKLHLNQMIDLGLDIFTMAQQVAESLAIMHWAARTDARDVEFVLGSSTIKHPAQSFTSEELCRIPPGTYTGPVSRNVEDFFHRKTDLWVLDFNQVKPITMDDTGVEQAVLAAKINDPYIPKPSRASKTESGLWNHFVRCYVEVADSILTHEDLSIRELPGKFLKGLIEKAQ